MSPNTQLKIVLNINISLLFSYEIFPFFFHMNFGVLHQCGIEMRTDLHGEPILRFVFEYHRKIKKKMRIKKNTVCDGLASIFDKFEHRRKPDTIDSAAVEA